jgi:hypothetical protein
MFESLCEDEHDAQAMKIVNRAFVAITVCFIAFGAFAISTRLGGGAPPTSVSYGTEKAHPASHVIGD